MALELDKREEGLRELARMISAAYRRRMTGEGVAVLTSTETAMKTGREARATAYPEPPDLRREGDSVEVVSVEYFIRRKVPGAAPLNRRSTKEDVVLNAKGGPRCHR